MTYDSFNWLLQARTGNWDDVQPIGSALLFRLLDTLYPGPILFMSFNLIMVVAGTVAIFFLSSAGIVRNVILAALVLFCPVCLTILGFIWRDITGLGLVLLAVASCLMISEKQSRGQRWLFFSFVVLLTIAGSFFRVNNAAGAWPILFYALVRMFGRGSLDLKKILICVALSGIILTTATLGAMQVTTKMAKKQWFFGQVPINYQLAEMSLIAEVNFFPEQLFPDLSLEVIREQMAPPKIKKNPYFRLFFRAYLTDENRFFPRLLNQEYVELTQAYKKIISQHPHIALKARVRGINNWIFKEDLLQYGLHGPGFSNLRMWKNKVEINFTTTHPRWSEKFLIDMNTFVKAKKFSVQPLLYIGVSLLGVLLAWIYVLPNRMVITILSISSCLHFTSIVLVASYYEFRWGHQSIFCSILAISLFFNDTITRMKENRAMAKVHRG